MDFINKLDKDQLDNFNRVFDSALDVGVDPRLATSLAYTESRLKQFDGKNVLIGKDGEVGMMQVKPSTAKQLGFKMEDLHDPDKNVRIGLTYLKSAMDRYNDPILSVIAYNAGPDNDFLLGKTDKNPSERYVNEIGSYGGFVPYQSRQEKEAEEQAKQPVEVSDHDYSRSLEAGLIGAGAGATAGATLGLGKGVYDTAKAIKQAPEALREATREIAALRQSQGVPTEAQHTRQMQGTTQEGATGRARMQTFNEQTAQQAAAKREAQATLERLKRAGLITGENPLVKSAGLTSTPSGVLLPSGTVYEPAAVPKPKPPTPLQAAGSKVGSLAKTAIFNPVVSGGLAGLGAGFSAQEAKQRWDQGDIPGAAIAGAGALGSVASAIPHPLTKGIGAATAIASPAALYLLDKMRRNTQEQPSLGMPSP